MGESLCYYERINVLLTYRELSKKFVGKRSCFEIIMYLCKQDKYDITKKN